MRAMKMPGQSYTGPLAELSGAEREIGHGLSRHVRALAGEIGERNVAHYDALTAAAEHIERGFQDLGYTPRRQLFEVAEHPVRNVEAVLTGRSRPGEAVVVGAHYDTVIGCPGANDNGTGVAATLEIARVLRDRPLARSVRFVAFANEEPPYFQTPAMGSLVYAQGCRQRGDSVVGMLSLETIGYYSDERGSQEYPFPFRRFYPSTGNFIGFVSNLDSRRLLHECVGSFRRHARFPSEGVAAPGFLAGIGFSDHWSFWQAGYPALMVTDTAPFRYPHYHTRDDTPDKIDVERAARVVAGLAEVVADLAGAN